MSRNGKDRAGALPAMTISLRFMDESRFQFLPMYVKHVGQIWTLSENEGFYTAEFKISQLANVLWC